MPKVTLTFSDKANGKIDMEMNFQPALKTGEELTEAQKLGDGLAQAIGRKLAPEAFKVMDQKFAAKNKRSK